MSIDIYQCSAAVAWVDWRVGLDEQHGTIRIWLASEGANDPKGHGILQSLRAADGKHKFSLARSTNVGQGEEGKVFGLDLDQCQVQVAVAANEMRVKDAHRAGW